MAPTEASAVQSAGQGALWPGRIRADYQVIDWNQAAADLVRAINAPQGKVAVTFASGVKVALSDASVVDAERAGGLPGTVLSHCNGPIEVVARDGVVRVARYAFEGRIDYWRFHERLADFAGHFPQLFLGQMRLTAERFEVFQNVLNRFTVTFGIDAPSGKAARPEPPDAYSVLHGSTHLYLANREWLLQLYKRLALKPGARALDIGCGGVWTSLAAREAGLEAWGCDLYVDDYYDSVSDWFRYFQCDAADMRELPVKFDFIFFRGLTPMVYSRNIFCPELLKFRDRVLEGLAEDGAVFTELYSRNTGVSASPQDYGNSTVEQLHEWMGRFFPNTEYSRGQYVCMLASHRPIIEPWRTAPIFGSSIDALAEVDFIKEWRTFRARTLDDVTYHLMLLKITQAFFRRTPLRAGGPVFILGEGQLADDLRFLIQQIQRTFILRGSGAKLPDDLPQDTFVFILPEAKPPGAMPFDHFKITCAELVGRAMTRDIWSTCQDHDLVRIGFLLETRAKRQREKDVQLGVQAERAARRPDQLRKAEQKRERLQAELARKAEEKRKQLQERAQRTEERRARLQAERVQRTEERRARLQAERVQRVEERRARLQAERARRIEERRARLQAERAQRAAKKR